MDLTESFLMIIIHMVEKTCCSSEAVLYFRFSGSKCPNFKREILEFTSEVLTLSKDIKTTQQFFLRTCFFSSVRESADCFYFRELIWVDVDAGSFFKPSHSCIDINT